MKMKTLFLTLLISCSIFSNAQIYGPNGVKVAFAFPAGRPTSSTYMFPTFQVDKVESADTIKVNIYDLETYIHLDTIQSHLNFLQLTTSYNLLAGAKVYVNASALPGTAYSLIVTTNYYGTRNVVDTIQVTATGVIRSYIYNGTVFLPVINNTWYTSGNGSTSNPLLSSTSGKIDLHRIAANGVNYYITMSDTIPGLPYHIPHLGLFAGPALGMHSFFEMEDNTTFGTHPPLFTVEGVIDNQGSTHFTVSCDTAVDIHTQDTLNTFNLHYHFGAAGLSLFSGGSYSGATGLKLDANQTALDIVGGFVPAVLDSVQLIAVASPALGQIYFCSDCSSNAGNGLNAQWTGSLWRKW